MPPQHGDVAVREHLAQAHRVHLACYAYPAPLGVAPGPHLTPRHVRRVGQQRRRGVAPHAVLAHRHERCAVPCHEPQRVVADGGAGPQQYHGEGLKRYPVLSGVQAAVGRGSALPRETKSSVPHGERPTRQPQQPMPVGMGDPRRFESQSSA